MQKGTRSTERIRKRIGILLVILFGMSLCPVSGFAADADGSTEGEKQFKVIGYYSGSLFSDPLERLQTDKLTHIVYAFLIPQEDGNLVPLDEPDELKQLIAKAHRDGAKVLIALGGWSYQGKPLVTVFESVAASDETRALLVGNVSAFVKEYGLDGVELDWEHPSQTSIRNYEKLVVDLRKTLEADGRILTAALNGAWSTTAGPEVSKLMTDVCLDSFSFINVMAYDMNNAEHSPLWFADTSINYWLNRGVPADEIILGMPLYARPSWKQYRHLAAENKEFAYMDHVSSGTLESYYNGLNTLREKTFIAMKKAGGVMLFDVNEDTDDETSAVSMIHDLKTRTAGQSREDLKKSVFAILNNRELVFLREEGYGVPFIDSNNRMMIPFRKPVEAIGAAVSYDENKKEITAVKSGVTVKLVIGENRIHVNGQETAMDTKAVLKDGRTYIPLRAVFSAFGCDLNWHGSSNTVYITELEN